MQIARLHGARQKEARWKRRDRKETAIKKTKDKQPKAKDNTPEKSRYGTKKKNNKVGDVEASAVTFDTGFFLDSLGSFLLLLGD